MESDIVGCNFIGSPVSVESSYTFHHAICYKTSNGQVHILKPGDFFYFQATEQDPVCIGELQLLWTDHKRDGMQLTWSRLYFLPETTPEGRNEQHGKDELVCMKGKIVLKLEDLVKHIPKHVFWEQGYSCRVDKEGGSSSPAADHQALEDACVSCPAIKERVNNNVLLPATSSKGRHQMLHNCPVLVASFAQYSRQLALDMWLDAEDLTSDVSPAIVSGSVYRMLGGVTAAKDGGFLMFCRRQFAFPEFFDHAIICDEELIPKHKQKKEKKENAPSEMNGVITSGGEGESLCSDRSSDDAASSSDEWEPKNKGSFDAHGLGVQKKKKALETVPILSRGVLTLLDNKDVFMKLLQLCIRDRKLSLDGMQNLGLKDVDFFDMYCVTRKLGGYSHVCEKRMWKKVYEYLGGAPGNPSSATVARRHFEKMLLPFERWCCEHADQLLSSTTPTSILSLSDNTSLDEGVSQGASKRKKRKNAAPERFTTDASVESQMINNNNASNFLSHMNEMLSNGRQQQGPVGLAGALGLPPFKGVMDTQPSSVLQYLSDKAKNLKEEDSKPNDLEKQWNEIRKRNQIERTQSKQARKGSKRPSPPPSGDVKLNQWKDMLEALRLRPGVNTANLQVLQEQMEQLVRMAGGNNNTTLGGIKDENGEPNLQSHLLSSVGTNETAAIAALSGAADPVLAMQRLALSTLGSVTKPDAEKKRQLAFLEPYIQPCPYIPLKAPIFVGPDDDFKGKDDKKGQQPTPAHSKPFRYVSDGLVTAATSGSVRPVPPGVLPSRIPQTNRSPSTRVRDTAQTRKSSSPTPATAQLARGEKRSRTRDTRVTGNNRRTPTPQHQLLLQQQQQLTNKNKNTNSLPNFSSQQQLLAAAQQHSRAQQQQQQQQQQQPFLALAAQQQQQEKLQKATELENQALAASLFPGYPWMGMFPPGLGAGAGGANPAAAAAAAAANPLLQQGAVDPQMLLALQQQQQQLFLQQLQMLGMAGGANPAAAFNPFLLNPGAATSLATSSLPSTSVSALSAVGLAGLASAAGSSAPMLTPAMASALQTATSSATTPPALGVTGNKKNALSQLNRFPT